ncbi:MAG: exodeoxyribonuclease VII large subunit [Candidatus Zixiibacteriota bacterium]
MSELFSFEKDRNNKKKSHNNQDIEINNESSGDDKPKPLSVTELNKKVLKVIEGHFVHGIWVEAEIRNFKNHSSGHWYFSLVDEESQVSGVMWRGSTKSVGFMPKDGNKLLVYGKPTMYTRRGNYQFMVLKMLPAGMGARQIALRQLKEKLMKEGLFEPSHKKLLPRMPNRIGVVTSSTGAAFRDIMNVLERRAPYVEIILRPATVQGLDAGIDIARGVEELNRYRKIDLMIVGRGGGSEDDLWCFNDETLARAIYESKIPVISAVGHEIDNPISDLVADVRAPTPSAAAELAVTDSAEIMLSIKDQKARLARALMAQYQAKIDRLQRVRAERIPIMLQRRIDDNFQQIDMANTRLFRSIIRNFDKKANRLKTLETRLKSTSPLSILSRGYSIVRFKRSGEIIRDSEILKNGDLVNIEFHKGNVDAKVKAGSSKKSPSKAKSKKKRKESPSLFD